MIWIIIFLIRNNKNAYTGINKKQFSHFILKVQVKYSNRLRLIIMSIFYHYWSKSSGEQYYK